MDIRNTYYLSSPPCRWIRRYSAILLLAMPLLVLTACSFSFTYRQLDWLIPWHLSDYIRLDSTQSSELERRLVARLDWHCSTQLDAYAEWFREMHAESHPFTRDHLEHHYQRSLDFWRLLMEKLTPDITALLLSASDAQVDELMRNMEQRNRELEERYVTASREKIQQHRRERMEKILRRWIGPFNEAQKRALDAWARGLGQSGEAWMESRRRWQRKLEESFALRAEPERFAARIHTLFVEPRQLWPESYQEEYARLRARTLDMLAQMSAAQTPAQEQHFRHQLLSWAEDFEHLACLSPETGATYRGPTVQSKE